MSVEKSALNAWYTKLAMVMIAVIAIFFIAIMGKKILSPLIFAFLFSIVLLPVTQFFENKLRFRRNLASVFSVILLIAIVTAVLSLIASQLSGLMQDLPQFKSQLLESFNNMQNWISSTFHVNIAKQKAYVNNAASKAMSSGTEVVGAAVISVSSLLFFLVFTAIYTFFFLFYRRLLLSFLLSVFRKEDDKIVYDIIENVQFIIRKYIVGLFIEMTIVTVVCCTAFTILGIKYAILLGLITGVFNIIPYIGIFTSLVIGSLITFATAASITKVWLVVAVIVSMHLIDSNLLLPLIVGSKVRINALITLLGVIVGEMIWGITGMFLSIPVIAILKIICDRVENLNPWGMLLGDEKNELPPKKSGSKKTR